MSKPPTDDPKAMRALWRKEERNKRLAEKAAAEAIKEDAYVDPEVVGAQTDWEKLTEIANSKFPSHLAEKFKLSGRMRTAAIASRLGWTHSKIADACGLAQSTVSKWFQREEMKDFIRAYEYHSGTQDAKGILDQEMYATIQTMISIRDDITLQASTRADAAKWLWEQKYGKAKESREIKGINLRDLTEAVRSSRTPAEFDDAPSIIPIKPSTN